MSKSTKLLGVMLAAIMTVPVQAADLAIAAGAAVVDTTGAPVGRIEAVQGNVAVISTGTARASVDVASLRPGAGGLVIGMSRAELEAASMRAQAQASSAVKALLQPGATVYGSDGAQAATVDAVDDQYVTLAVESAKAKLPLSAFSRTDGGLAIGMTAEQLKAAVRAQMPASSPPSSPVTPPAEPPAGR